MKTNIEIADELLVRAKWMARREGKALREFVDEALRQHLANSPAQAPFLLEKHPFGGEAGQHLEADWESIRDTIYRLG